MESSIEPKEFLKDKPEFTTSPALKVTKQQETVNQSLSSGSKVGDGTLGCFCRDPKDQHFILTAGHVIVQSDDPNISSRNKLDQLDTAIFKYCSGSKSCYLGNVDCSLRFPKKEDVTQSILKTAYPQLVYWDEGEDDQIDPYDPKNVDFIGLGDLLNSQCIVVFKKGQKTGLTAGILDNVKLATDTAYERLVIHWITKEE